MKSNAIKVITSVVNNSCWRLANLTEEQNYNSFMFVYAVSDVTIHVHLYADGTAEVSTAEIWDADNGFEKSQYYTDRFITLLEDNGFTIYQYGN